MGKVYCTKCGKELSDSAKFCTKCGNQLDINVLTLNSNELIKDTNTPNKNSINTRHIEKNGLSFDCPDYYDIGKYPSSDEAHKSMVALSKKDRKCEIYITVYRKNKFDNNAKRNNYLLKEYLKLHGYTNIRENKNLPYCFNANINHHIGNIKTTIVYNFDYDDVIMIVGNITPSSNYDCIDDIKIILNTIYYDNSIIKRVKQKITSKNKTILGIISIALTILFVPFLNINYVLEFPILYMPTMIPAIFLIIPFGFIKDSKFLSLLFTPFVLIFIVLNLYFMLSELSILSLQTYSAYLVILCYIWVLLYCLFNLFCALILSVPTGSKINSKDKPID